MNVFDAVKQSVTAREAAEHYGIHVRPNGMACCPFHHDRTPSMKLDRRYHCFGCGADGNVIDFVSGFLGISSTEAAMKLAQDFGVTYEYRGRARDRPIKATMQKPVQAKEFLMDELQMWRILCDYLHLLRKWKTVYAPQPEDEDWHPLFCEALSKITIVEYYLDILMDGTDDERAFFVANHGKEVKKIAMRLGKLDR